MTRAQAPEQYRAARRCYLLSVDDEQRAVHVALMDEAQPHIGMSPVGHVLRGVPKGAKLRDTGRRLCARTARQAWHAHLAPVSRRSLRDELVRKQCLAVAQRGLDCGA